MPEELQDAPPLPYLTAHIWGWFCELHGSRNYDMNGNPSRITASEMRDLRWANGIEIEIWERRALRNLDTVYFNSRAEK